MASKVRKTRLHLPENVRAEVAALLNARLAEATDYALQLKQHITTDLTPDEVHMLGLTEVARIQAEILGI